MSDIVPMRRRVVIALLGVTAAACSAPPVPERQEPPAVVWKAGPRLPAPVTNNAVAAVKTDAGVAVFSFMGLDSTKVWSGVTNAAYRWDVGSTEGWRPVDPVPGPGRLAATAQVVRGKIYVFGGYTVAADGKERSLPDVNVYDPSSGTWSRGRDIPVPVDDAVSGVWRDSLVVLVSGWRNGASVDRVQWYDPAADRWSEATPIAGRPVFGHAGAVVADHIIYVDGAAAVDDTRRFALDTAAWMGDITSGDPSLVAWSSLGEHPLPALYRAAGGSVGGLALFVGGSENPYNYDGIGYDGVPAEPIRQVLAFAPRADEWRNLAAPPLATMDHRTLGVAGGMVFLVGGMEEGQVVSGKVWYADVEALLASIW
ncbi:MAG: Kelch repeat-containing protein [Longimicrobiales bacterium]